VLMLPRPSLNTQGLVPLLAATKETHPDTKDAQRYRFLRDLAARSDNPAPDGSVYVHFSAPQGDWSADQDAAADLDAAIDSALGEKGEKL
jgi:hypothetical protein